MNTNTFSMFSTSKPFARWWWFSGKISFEQIDEQLDWFSKQGFGGVEIAWVYPYQGAKKEEGATYLDEAFQTLLQHTLEGCKNRNLGCDLTFGTLWPFNGTFIPEKYASKTFEGYSSQIVNRSWEARYTEKPAKVLDHLDPDALDWYAKYHFSHGFENFAKTYPLSFFCDSWEVETDRLFYDGLYDDFQQKYGYSLEKTLDTLNSDKELRFDYRCCISERVLQSFYLPFTKLCNQVGARSRVQCHGAPTDVLASYALVDIPESETLLFDPDFSLLASSAAAYHDKPLVSSETFSCIYGWVPTPQTPPGLREELVQDLRCVADAQFAWGVNRVVWHGKPFSTQKDPKQFYASVHLGEDGKLNENLPSFNAYLETVSRYLSKGETYSNLAVYFPLEDQWMHDELPEELKKPSSNFYWELQAVHMQDALSAYRPLWFSGKWLEKLQYEKPFLTYNTQRFEALLCDSEWMLLSSLVQLARLKEQGAPIIFKRLPKEPGKSKHSEYARLLARLQCYESTEISAVHPILESQQVLDYWCRKAGDDYYLFISHPQMRNLSYPLEYGYNKTIKEETIKAHFHTETNDYRLLLEFPAQVSLLIKISDAKKLMTTIELPSIE